MFYFHLYLGKIRILTNIFQMGWNHQLERIFDLPEINMFVGILAHRTSDDEQGVYNHLLRKVFSFHC